MRSAAYIRRFAVLLLFCGTIIAGADCAPPDSFNVGDPTSEEFHLFNLTRCALQDVQICPLGLADLFGPAVVSQIQPGAAGSNLKLWLEADALSQGDGTQVTTWPDQSGNGFNANQISSTEQPLFKVGVLSGKSAVRFDGGLLPGDHMILGSNYLFSANDGITILAVVRSDAEDETTDYILDFGKNNDTGYGLAYSANSDGSGDNVRMYAAPTSGGGTVNGPFPAATTDVALVVARIKFEPALDKHVSIYINGTLRFTDTAHTLLQLTATEINESAVRTTNNGPVTIGGLSKSNVQSGKFFKGDIGLVLWFDKALTETERQGLECYAALKYSITVSQICI